MTDETVCEICSAELPVGDLFQCEDCGIEGCSVCVEAHMESDGAVLCADCNAKRNKGARKAPRRKK